MNQIATRESVNAVGIAGGATGAKIAPQNLGEVVRFAEVMAKADIALPKHLRGNPGACMAVALQALEWQMSPFAVASKSYAVNGAIAYEAQLIIAVVNTRSGIEGRLKYRFEGEGPDRVCYCSGKLDGEELEVRSPRFADITPKNSPLWKSDPDQQQCYYTGRSWARRHTPEVILGVYDRDEAEQFRGPDNAKDVTPSVMDRLKAAQKPAEETEGAREGFDPDFVTRETETLSTGQNSDDSALPLASSDEAGDPPPSPADKDGDGEPSSPSSPSDQTEPEPIADEERQMLVRFAADVLPKAADPKMTGEALTKIEKRWAADLGELSDRARNMATQISRSMRAILKDEADFSAAVSFFEEMLDAEGQIGGSNAP